MDNITSQEYWAEIASLARECAEADAPSDAVHAACDLHEWVIYTFYNMQVLTHSRNENAWFDDFGTLKATDFSGTMAKLACAAMMADVRDTMAESEST
jgi:hypothetical protein